MSRALSSIDIALIFWGGIERKSGNPRETFDGISLNPTTRDGMAGLNGFYPQRLLWRHWCEPGVNSTSMGHTKEHVSVHLPPFILTWIR